MSMFRKSNITVRIEETTLIGISFQMDYMLQILLLAQNVEETCLRYLIQTDVFSNFHCINSGLEELRLPGFNK